MALTEQARDPTRGRLSRLVVVLLAGIGFVILGLSAYYGVTARSLVHAGSMRLEPDLTITALSEKARNAGFVVDDRLQSIADQQVTTLLNLRSALRQVSAGTATDVEVQRTGQLVPLHVIVAAAPLELRLFVLFALAITYMGLGTLVAYQRPLDKAAFLFFLTALALGLYFGLQQRSEVGFVYARVFVLTLAPASALHFFVTFPEERKLARTPWWLLLYVPSALLLVLTIVALAKSVAAGTGIWYAPRFETLMNFNFAYLIAVGALGLASTTYTYSSTRSARLKRQLQWIMWGLTCAVAAGVIDIALTLGQSHTLVSSTLLLIGTVCLLLGFAFAILRSHLLDIDLVVNRSVVYTVLTATLAAIYLLLIAILSNALGIATRSQTYTLVLFLSALLIGFIASPLRAKIQDVIDRAFFRQQISYQDALIRWSQELNTSIRFAGLTKLLVYEVPRQMMIERARLLVLSKDESLFYPLPTDAENNPEGSPNQFGISSRSMVARRLARPGEVFLVDEWSAEPIGELPESWLSARIQIILPLVCDGKLQGIYLLGRKLSDDVYQRQELDLLRTLANQASVSISNARLYEQVHSLSQELEKTVQERTQELRDFVSIVYHELSTPITSIRGYSDLLLEGKIGALNERQTRYLTSIRRSTRRLIRLVADLSDVSRIDDGRLSLYAEPLDLRTATLEAVSTLSGTIDEKGLGMTLALAPEASSVEGDPQRVLQILTNLVSNACRFTPAGGHITITARSLDSFAEISVQDTGIGIDRDELPLIFGRFYRSDDPRVQEQPGTGLGLAITKALVELHQGDIWVESALEKGSVFTFTLPLAQPPPAQRTETPGS